MTTSGLRAAHTLLDAGATAAFDFDNTLIHNDLGETLFQHLALEGLLDYKSIFASKTLWFRSPAKAAALRQWRQGRRRALGLSLIATYQDICRRQGRAVSYPWVAKIFTGLTPAFMHTATLQVMRTALREPLGTHTERGARLTYGIRIHTEIGHLVDGLKDKGVDVWIVSANNRWCIEAVAKRYFGISPRRVLAMTPEVAGGRIRDHIDTVKHPITFRQGKADVITRALGGPPDLAAGDSMTDWEMLCSAKTVKIFLPHGDYKALRLVDRAKKQTGSGHWIVYRCAY